MFERSLSLAKYIKEGGNNGKNVRPHDSNVGNSHSFGHIGPLPSTRSAPPVAQERGNFAVTNPSYLNCCLRHRLTHPSCNIQRPKVEEKGISAEICY